MSNAATHRSHGLYHSSPYLPSDHRYQVVALVLQGGGALGAYQAGVYQGLAEHDLHPNWVAGISIGALNAALIAGNPPELRLAKLNEFWRLICRPSAFASSPCPTLTPFQSNAVWFNKWLASTDIMRTVFEGQPHFFTPRSPWSALSGATSELSFYDISSLKSTLETLVDFDRLNHPNPMRVSVGAVNIRTGDFVYFDNTQTRLTPEHFMASAALPPGFPPVEIEGEYYWDGGLVSNTPLQQVVSTEPRKNSLVFQVDLWSARGQLPTDFSQLGMRYKEIMYSSRTRAITHAMASEQRYRGLLNEVMALVPPEQHHHPSYTKLSALACERMLNIIHLIYQRKEYEGVCSDTQFSAQQMTEHWNSGYQDIIHSLKNKHWFNMPTAANPFVTHDVHRHKKNSKTM